MPKTSLRLKLSVWGTNVDPDSLTKQFGVSSWGVRMGESRGRRAKERAGWGWVSEETGADIQETLTTFLELFSPHEAVFQSCVAEGAEVFISISGTTEVGVVDSPEEADSRQYEIPDPFSPFADADRVELFFDPKFLRFLSAISATLQTYIDIELEEDV